MILLVIVFLTIILLVYNIWKTNFGTFAYWKKCGIPQAPGSLPIIGNMWPVLSLRTHFSELIRQYYEMFDGYSMVGFNDNETPALILRDPELVKQVLQVNFANFQQNKILLHEDLDPLLSKNPFFSSGQVWTESRKSLARAFSSMRLKMLANTVDMVCNKFDDFLAQLLNDSNRVELELKDLFTRFTGEVVANAAFGVEGFTFNNEDHPMSFRRMGKELFDSPSGGGITQLISLYFPLLSKIFGIRFVPKHVDLFVNKLVECIIEERKYKPNDTSDFMQLMINQEENPETVAARAFAFFMNGYETSSITLSFVCHQIALHPNIQQKLRQEVIDVLAQHDNSINIESLKEMTYMNQVINESMRLYPSVPVMAKVCTNEFELKGIDGINCHVKPGTEVIIPNIALQNDRTYWSDPEKFDPERFSANRKSEISKFSYVPFGEGPRICVGMRVGILQTKAALTTLLKNYSLEFSPKTKLPLKMEPAAFLLTPRGGLWVYVKHI